VVAICNNEIIGFLIGYLKPNDPNCLFLWQGFVLEKFRKKSITSTMVKKLLNSEISQVVKSVEATICPSNIPSIKLIESITKEKKGRLKTTEFISAENFKGTSHEQELLYRIELPS
jgi:L-2,4-diaminobutyric acid acetyltransferase